MPFQFKRQESLFDCVVVHECSVIVYFWRRTVLETSILTWCYNFAMGQQCTSLSERFHSLVSWLFYLQFGCFLLSMLFEVYCHALPGKLMRRVLSGNPLLSFEGSHRRLKSGRDTSTWVSTLMVIRIICLLRTVAYSMQFYSVSRLMARANSNNKLRQLETVMTFTWFFGPHSVFSWIHEAISQIHDWMTCNPSSNRSS